MFRRRVLVPAESGVPADLPPWARDELVRRRLEASDMKRQIISLRVELARARGEDLGGLMKQVMRDD